MKILISGGPGAGSTSTAAVVGKRLEIPVFDSDTFFHKPTDPPFQEQNSPEKRRALLEAALSEHEEWIVSGSIATWGMVRLKPTHGILLDIPSEVRVERLEARQRSQFGSRIDKGGDLYGEHTSFMKWAAKYDARSDKGRCLHTDRNFLTANCEKTMSLEKPLQLDEVAGAVVRFISDREAP